MGISIRGRSGWGAFPYTVGRSRLPHPTFHLLFNLLTHAEGFNATYSIITEQTGMSSKTIAAALDNLKKLDLITVGKKKGANGRFDSNQYTFHADRLWQITPEFVDERLRGKKPAVEGKEGESNRFTRESRTAVEGKAGPLYEGKTKEDHLETTSKNDQSEGAVAPVADAPAPKKKSRKKPALPLPENWAPADRTVRAMAEECPTVNQEKELLAFRDHWWSKDERRASWDATYRNWIRRSAEWSSNKQNTRSGSNSLADWGAPSTMQGQAPAGPNPFRSIYDEQRAING